MKTDFYSDSSDSNLLVEIAGTTFTYDGLVPGGMDQVDAAQAFRYCGFTILAMEAEEGVHWTVLGLDKNYAVFKSPHEAGAWARGMTAGHMSGYRQGKQAGREEAALVARASESGPVEEL